MLAKPGDKVLIIEDCREGSPATGQVGVYEGKFPRAAIVRGLGFWREYSYDVFIEGKVRFTAGEFTLDPLVKHIPFWSLGNREPHPKGEGFPVLATAHDPKPPYWFSTDNPRIRLPDGSTIWGDECWWGDAKTAPPLEEAQADLKDHKTVLRGMAQAMADE